VKQSCRKVFREEAGAANGNGRRSLRYRHVLAKAEIVAERC